MMLNENNEGRMSVAVENITSRFVGLAAVYHSAHVRSQHFGAT